MQQNHFLCALESTDQVTTFFVRERGHDGSSWYGTLHGMDVSALT